jgi:uncharacterized SAM-binding protein YcdF (DUF218 family)
LEPALPLLLLVGLAGLLGVRRHSSKNRSFLLLTISITGILLLSMNSVAWLISRPLEVWYSHDPLLPGLAEAIVILSGTVHDPTQDRPYTLAAEDTYERLEHGVWLFKEWKRLPILVCGGALAKGGPYAATMKRVLEFEGVPTDLIWIEDRSKSTHENAEFGSKILRERGVSRIALVVEANSMLRAAASFRKAGITVIPAPIRFTELDYGLPDVFPNWRAIALNDEALHEYLGLIWYRIRGWI